MHSPQIAVLHAAHNLFKAMERYVGGLILFGLERFITHLYYKKCMFIFSQILPQVVSVSHIISAEVHCI